MTKYEKFVNSNIPRLPVYKDLAVSDFKSTENNLGLSTMLSNFDMFILEDKQENIEDYVPNTLLHFLSDFNTFLCKNQKF